MVRIFLNSQKMSHINIPIELIIEILKWVPAKSLICFMSVCKSWYFLITSSNFIKTHLNHQISITNSNENSRFLIYKCNNSLCYYSLYCDNDEFRKEFELVTPNSELKPIGCCNGIICLTDRLKFCLWNLAMRKYLNLRMPHVSNVSKELFVHGFGFDSSTDDYKVVSIAYLCSGSEVGETRSIDVCVYSVNSGAWKVVNGSFKWDGCYFVLDRGVHLNGVIHWVVERCFIDRDVPAFILTFDLGKETFSQIRFPKDVVYVPLVYEMVDQFEPYDRVDLMTIKKNDEEFLVVVQFDQVSLTLWVMDDNGVGKSWNEDVSIKRDVSYMSVENVRMNGELVTEKGRNMVSLSPKSLRIKHISHHKMKYVGTYVESLVLLKPVKALRDATCENLVD